MANVGYRRSYGLVAAALMTLCVSSPSYATSASATRTFATSDWPCANFVVIEMGYSFPAGYPFPGFDLAAPAAIKIPRDVVALRHPPEHPAMAIHQRRSLSAVRPSAVAGWRSGRVRRLASA